LLLTELLHKICRTAGLDFCRFFSPLLDSFPLIVTQGRVIDWLFIVRSILRAENFEKYIFFGASVIATALLAKTGTLGARGTWSEIGSKKIIDLVKSVGNLGDCRNFWQFDDFLITLQFL